MKSIWPECKLSSIVHTFSLKFENRRRAFSQFASKQQGPSTRSVNLNRLWRKVDSPGGGYQNSTVSLVSLRHEINMSQVQILSDFSYFFFEIRKSKTSVFSICLQTTITFNKKCSISTGCGEKVLRLTEDLLGHFD